VVRAVFYKYGHPKECLINDALICPILLEAILRDEQENFTILYPNGCSLNVSKPSLPIMTSGTTSYPVNRPIGAIYQASGSRGKLIVFGAGHAFTEK